MVGTQDIKDHLHMIKEHQLSVFCEASKSGKIRKKFKKKRIGKLSNHDPFSPGGQSGVKRKKRRKQGSGTWSGEHGAAPSMFIGDVPMARTGMY